MLWVTMTREDVSRSYPCVLSDRWDRKHYVPGLDSWLVTQPLAREALPGNKFEVIQADFGHVTKWLTIV